MLDARCAGLHHVEAFVGLHRTICPNQEENIAHTLQFTDNMKVELMQVNIPLLNYPAAEHCMTVGLQAIFKERALLLIN